MTVEPTTDETARSQLRGRRPVPVHYLRANEKCWTPPVCLFLDVETEAVEHPLGELLRPVLWCSVEIERRRQRARDREDTWSRGNTSDELARHVNEVGLRQRATWVWAHNVNFDATATALPTRLARLGWEITEFSTRGTAPWFRLRAGRHSLVIVDSWSWLPVALEKVGQAVGITKPPLPPPDAPREHLSARCEADVAITAKAVCDLLDWWDRNNLGRWGLTGAACGWNAFRHIPHPQRVLIDHDLPAIDFERQAIYGGRREAFQVGKLPEGRYVDMDLRNAYPAAAFHFRLPMKRVARFADLPLDHAFVKAPSYGLLTWATLKLDQPTVPVRIKGQVWYPTGKVRTVLASPELDPLLDAGQVESIGPGYVYRLGRSLRPWAQWCIAVANGEVDDAPAVAQIAAKHWSRTVIGKFATRSSRSLRYGPSPNPGWHLEEGRDHTLGLPSDWVDMAGQRWRIIYDLDGDNVFPAITAFVESHVRHRLTKVMEALPSTRVLQCDTDGFLLDDSPRLALMTVIDPAISPESKLLAHFHQQEADMVAAAAPFTLARKSEHTDVEILGPQHLFLGDERRLSGIPRDATTTDRYTYETLLWPKLKWQMAHGDPEGYVRPRGKVTVRGPYTHHWVLDDLTTAPVMSDVDQLGRTFLLPYAESWAGQAGLELATNQHPLLESLR